MAGHDSLAAAASWIGTLMVGTVASAVAILAVAGLGLAMLAGRLPWRRGIEAVIGMFVIFGASMLAQDLARPRSPEVEELAGQPSPPLAVRLPPAAVYDPYAGASVPQRSEVSKILTPDQ